MDKDILEKVKALMREQGTCVLATAFENQPHCSLMAYVTNASCDEIYFMTQSNSRKYQNMCKNPAVSVLIDTRQKSAKFDPGQTSALTVSGRFDRVEGEMERDRIRKALSQKHPALKRFFEDQRGEPVRIILEAYLLLEGPTTARYGRMS